MYSAAGIFKGTLEDGTISRKEQNLSLKQLNDTGVTGAGGSEIFRDTKAFLAWKWLGTLETVTASPV